MKIYTLIALMLLAISGCSTSYKGSIKGASIQEESNAGKDVAGKATENPVKP